MKGQDSSEGDQPKPPWTPLGCVLTFVAGSLLFPPLWVGANVAFGAALEGPILVFLMEAPCQRLAQTTEPLSRYKVGRGVLKGRTGASSSPSVCHFASRSVYVDRREGFLWREGVHAILGLVGYLACALGSFLLTIYLLITGVRFFDSRRARVQGSPPPPPKPARGSKSRRRRKR